MMIVINILLLLLLFLFVTNSIDRSFVDLSLLLVEWCFYCRFEAVCDVFEDVGNVALTLFCASLPCFINLKCYQGV